MPYVKRDIRTALAPTLDVLNDKLVTIAGKLPPNTFDGVLNYVITSIIDTHTERSYAAIMRAIGTLECVKLELYRRIAGPYEDVKCAENGDVYRK